MAEASSDELLTIRDLRVDFGATRVLDGVSLEVRRGAAVGVVGESGCGKSVTALSAMRLVRPPGRIASGSVRLAGRELLSLDERDMRALRGDRMAMIFQEPLTALNPVYSTGDQVAEVLRVHRGRSRRAAMAEAAELFRLVGIADPARRVDEYPHQMSGGMRQRVMIAMALACQPDLLIADEPTTALDVTIQAQILELLARLRREFGMALWLITHDLGVVAEVCDEVFVMYAGQVVERAPARALFARPRHPYTAGLVRAVPTLRTGGDATAGPRPRLAEIRGTVPRLDQLPTGCRFQDRCDRVQARCREGEPDLRSDGDRLVRCHFPVEDSSDAPSAACPP